jgi:hypothetical protein
VNIFVPFGKSQKFRILFWTLHTSIMQRHNPL